MMKIQSLEFLIQIKFLFGQKDFRVKDSGLVETNYSEISNIL